MDEYLKTTLSPSREVSSGKGIVISFVSAKGGSGKTLLTATAAYLLTSVGKKVLVIDTDFSTRGLTLYLLGTAHQNAFLVVRPENCLSDALVNNLPVESIEPRRIPRKELDFHLILASLTAYTSNEPDDRIVSEVSSFNPEPIGGYFDYLRRLIAHWRLTYDYILFDTRGGYDFTSAAPALLSDSYAFVLEADQISVNQVAGVKKKIEEWGQKYSIRPALGGFIVNKATSGVASRDDASGFGDSLVRFYGGAHFGTIPLDYEAVRAYQVRDIPTDSRPDSDFAYYSYSALERLFSPTLNWNADERKTIQLLATQIRTVWRARKVWEMVERALPSTVLILAAITAVSYFHMRDSQTSGNVTMFYLTCAVFVLAATFTSAFILLKNFYTWRIPRWSRIAIGAYGLVAAFGLFWITLVDVRRTFSKDALLARISAQNTLIEDQQNRLIGLTTSSTETSQKYLFVLEDKNRLQQQVTSLQSDISKLQSSNSELLARLNGRSTPDTEANPPTPEPVIAVDIPTDFKPRSEYQFINERGRGCACGSDNTVAFPDGEYNVYANQEFLFRYDGSQMCRKQAFRNFRGTVNWGPVTTSLHDFQPESYWAIAGTLKVKFARPGDYPVRVNLSAYCIDEGPAKCSNQCSASGTVQVHVRPATELQKR